MLPDKAKFVECSIINPALLLLMKHLIISQLNEYQFFSAFSWPESATHLSGITLYTVTNMGLIPEDAQHVRQPDAHQNKQGVVLGDGHRSVPAHIWLWKHCVGCALLSCDSWLCTIFALEEKN